MWMTWRRTKIPSESAGRERRLGTRSTLGRIQSRQAQQRGVVTTGSPARITGRRVPPRGSDTVLQGLDSRKLRRPDPRGNDRDLRPTDQPRFPRSGKAARGSVRSPPTASTHGSAVGTEENRIGSEFHLLGFRRRGLQPVRPRRGHGSRQTTRRRLQPALRLWRCRSRKDAPHQCDRTRGIGPRRTRAGHVSVFGGVHQRTGGAHPAQPHDGVQEQVPTCRRADRRRRAIPVREGAYPGRVLPYLQFAPRVQQTDRPLLGHRP